MSLSRAMDRQIEQLRQTDDVVDCAMRQVERRLAERRAAQDPYDGPNRRSRTSRRADELENLTERQRQTLIDALLEDSINED